MLGQGAVEVEGWSFGSCSRGVESRSCRGCLFWEAEVDSGEWLGSGMQCVAQLGHTHYKWFEFLYSRWSSGFHTSSI